MMADQPSRFAGYAGQHTWSSLTPWSLLNGLLIAVIGWGLFQLFPERGPNTTLLTLISTVWAFAMARFACAAQRGARNGPLFLDGGAGWSRVGLVTARYLALNLIWAVPWLLLRSDQETSAAGPAALMIGLSLTSLLSGVSIYVLVMLLTPPVFLVIATSAEEWLDLVRPTQWSAVFGGRLGELFSIYTSYIGTLVMAALLLTPVSVAISSNDPELGLQFAIGLGIYLVGIAASLGGGLCGAFVRSVLEGPLPTATTASPAHDPKPAAGPGADRSARRSSNAAGETNSSGKRALIDATHRCDAAKLLSKSDRTAAIAELQKLDEQFQPSPQVLHLLAVLLLEADQAQRAVSAAKRAIPLCLQRGHNLMAADLFRSFAAYAAELALDKDSLIAVGQSLLSKRDPRTAASALAMVIKQDADDVRAVKGLLQAADQLVIGKQDEHAVRIYEFLLGYCSHSPLAEFMKEGLARAQRRGTAV
jgi:hypothetical protein